MEQKYNEQLKAKNRAKLTRRLILFGLLFVFIFVFFIYPIFELSIKTQVINSDKIPSSFKDFKIAHVTDSFINPSDSLEQIQDSLEDMQADIVIFGGNIFLEQDPGYYENFQQMLENLTEKRNIFFYITKGETELNFSKEYSQKLYRKLQARGAFLLDNQGARLNQAGQTINIYGLTGRLEDYVKADQTFSLADKPKLNSDDFNLVISHNPSYIFDLQDENADLVLSGNRFGGWVRLPFIGGLFYRAETGLIEDNYQFGQSDLMITNGMGTEPGRIRLFNPKEIQEIILMR